MKCLTFIALLASAAYAVALPAAPDFASVEVAPLSGAEIETLETQESRYGHGGDHHGHGHRGHGHGHCGRGRFRG